MTVNNIVNMSLIKGLDLICITDHNSVKQLDSFRRVAQGKIKILLGVEIQSLEGVHILGYFPENSDLKTLQAYLDQYLIVRPNQPDYFGRQLILNEMDEIVDEEPRLLISSLHRTCSQIIDDIHALNGKAVLAHLYRKYGYINCFGKLDLNLPFDGVEVLVENRPQLLQDYPELTDKLILSNSDAHYLAMISEPENQLTKAEYLFLKGE